MGSTSVPLIERKQTEFSPWIVSLLSHSKDITWHKSLWQSQDVKSEVDLILGGTQCQNHDDFFITCIVHTLVLVEQGEPRGVGSLQRFQSIET